MKIDKLKKYESRKESEITTEQIKQSRETFVNLLTPVIEKMLKNPSGIRPVHESFSELARQAKGEIVRQPTIIQTSKSDTGIISGGSLEVPPKFTDIELELLRKIENGEY
jgi:methylthioribose-1-phosphate isomerase